MVMADGARAPPPDDAGSMVAARFQEFLQTFLVPSESNELTEQRLLEDYMQQIEYMVQCNRSTIFVNFQHLQERDPELAEAVSLEYYRFDPYLRHALSGLVAIDHEKYVFDVDRGQRFCNNKPQREFFVSFYNSPQQFSIRQLRAPRVGQLVSLKGTVTRTSEVRPELLYAFHICNKCARTYTTEQQLVYTEPSVCVNTACNKRDFSLIQDRSCFVDFQRVKIQESADQIPAGSMPRALDVICRNDGVEVAKAGDKVVITGHLAVIPDTSSASRVGESAVATRSSLASQQDGVSGLQKLGVREMTYKLVFVASHTHVPPAQQSQNKFSNIIPWFQQEDLLHSAHQSGCSFTDVDMAMIEKIHKTPNLYSVLTESICPSIYGHSEVKRGILLMLLGGVHKKTKEGIPLRGDINICIVGDPSCAKSQFLKYVHTFMPRTVYTSGKSSSAAGLTACVVRDPETGEFSVEAGALMLADNGICCIDEFDKMESADQVAIHEAMEQQTISITKAGIQATLNARASILAAANPIYGRYDITKPLKHNIQITPAIMSRFDLFFIIIDDCQPAIDAAICRHIIHMHKADGLREAAQKAPIDQESLLKYLLFARTLQPKITPRSYAVLVDCYRLLRQNDMLGKNKTAYRITVRQLESLVRLSEALARLHLDLEVKEVYVKEAYRLLQRSIIFVESQDVDLEELDQNEEQDSPHADEAAMDEGEATMIEAAADEAYREDTGGMAQFGDAPHVAESTVSAPQALPEAAPKAKASVSAKDYEEICQLLYIRLKQLEEEFLCDNSDADFPGCVWGELVDWYMLQWVKDTMDETQRDQRRKLVGQIIRRVVKHDGNIIMLNADEALPNERKHLKLHPSLFS